MNVFNVNSFFGILIIIFLVFFLLVGLLSLLFLARLFTLVITRKKGMSVMAGTTLAPSAPPPSYSEAIIDTGYSDNPPCYVDIIK